MNSSVRLIFPELGGGPVQGLNDAGVENFQGAIDVYLSRECGQNTADAAVGDKPARLEFDRLTVKAADIPGFADLRQTLNACFERWKGKGDKECEFFQQAVDLAHKEEISILKISDYGTTGLTGLDGDEKGRWFALVKSQGVSNKGDTAGGSFGIGKSSPFAASRFRTVFYGTRTREGSVALQGVSRLVTHANSKGRPTQGTGFIGEHDLDGGEGGAPIFRAIRKEENIPAVFSRVEPGTDIWVIGYRSGPEWQGDLIRSILSNFWPAIHRGSIQFRVGSSSIHKGNLSDLIAAHSGQEDFDAHSYYKAIGSEPIRKRLSHVGDCELYLTSSSPDLPKRVCMVRNAGMRIYDYHPRSCRVPFSGLFICTDSDGNKLLRKLEPPKHDTWDAKRIESVEGKRALDEIKSWIREEVKKLNPFFSGSSFNENELAKYLPDTDQNDLSDLPNEQSGQSEEETLEPKVLPEHKVATPVKSRPFVVVPGAGNSGGESSFIPVSEGGVVNPRKFQGDGKNGNDGNGDGDEGTQHTVEDTKPPKITVRSYRVGADGVYQVVLRSDTAYFGTVCVHAVGEDGAAENVSLVSAERVGENGNNDLLTVSGAAIHGVKLTAHTPLRLAVAIKAVGSRSLLAIASNDYQR